MFREEVLVIIINLVIVFLIIKGVTLIQMLHYSVNKEPFLFYHTLFCEEVFGALKCSAI